MPTQQRQRTDPRLLMTIAFVVIVMIPVLPIRAGVADQASVENAISKTRNIAHQTESKARAHHTRSANSDWQPANDC